MGSGKSFLGQQLAITLNKPLIDTDQLIVDKTGQSISSFFKEHGEEAFREQELLILTELLENTSGNVISTGGGFPCFNNNLDQMKRKGLTVYLKWPEKILVDRIESSSERPLVNQNRNSLEKFVSELMQRRSSIYEQAELVVASPTIETLIEVISNKLQSQHQ